MVQCSVGPVLFTDFASLLHDSTRMLLDTLPDAVQLVNLHVGTEVAGVTRHDLSLICHEINVEEM